MAGGLAVGDVLAGLLDLARDGGWVGVSFVSFNFLCVCTFGVDRDLQPISMPSTSLSLTLRSTFLMLSFSPVLFTAVVPKARGICTAAVLGRTLGMVLMTPDIVFVATSA